MRTRSVSDPPGADERGGDEDCLGELNGSRGEPFDLEGLAIAIIATTGARRICRSGERGCCCSAGAVFSSSGASTTRHVFLLVLTRTGSKGGGSCVCSLYSLILSLAWPGSRLVHVSVFLQNVAHFPWPLSLTTLRTNLCWLVVHCASLRPMISWLLGQAVRRPQRSVNLLRR